MPAPSAAFAGRTAIATGSARNIGRAISDVGIRRMLPFLDIGLEDRDSVTATNPTPALCLARTTSP